MRRRKSDRCWFAMDSLGINRRRWPGIFPTSGDGQLWRRVVALYWLLDPCWGSGRWPRGIEAPRLQAERLQVSWAGRQGAVSRDATFPLSSDAYARSRWGGEALGCPVYLFCPHCLQSRSLPASRAARTARQPVSPYLLSTKASTDLHAHASPSPRCIFHPIPRPILTTLSHEARLPCPSRRLGRCPEHWRVSLCAHTGG